MISIQESLSALERCHQERQTAVDCYVGAIKSVAHYTIELDPSVTEPQRQYLESLAADTAAGGARALGDSQATLRGLLRDYRDKASQYLKRLREELQGMAQAMEQVMSSLATSDGEHDSRLKKALGDLREVARSSSDTGIRNVVGHSVETIEDSLEQMQNEHQLTVSQLKVEMGVLHKRIDALEAAASLDQLTELYTRREMEERILGGHGTFCLLLVRVSGFRKAEVQYRPEVAAELTAAFTKRLRNSLPSTSAIGRWGNEEFVAMLSMTAVEATVIAKAIGEQLSGPYACLLAGKTVRPSLQLKVAVVDSEGTPPERILQRVRGFLSST